MRKHSREILACSSRLQFFFRTYFIGITFGFLYRFGKIPDFKDLQKMVASVSAKRSVHSLSSAPGMKSGLTDIDEPNFLSVIVTSEGVALINEIATHQSSCIMVLLFVSECVLTKPLGK